MDMCGMLDMCGICVGYVWNGYVWDMCGMLDMCGICVGYVWNGYVWDMCGVLDMCGICVGYVWNGHVWDMCGVLDMCGIRLEWICVGYVWCAGYVWDMCGVRYANNLLKNPATKRLSGKIGVVGKVHGGIKAKMRFGLGKGTDAFPDQCFGIWEWNKRSAFINGRCLTKG